MLHKLLSSFLALFLGLTAARGAGSEFILGTADSGRIIKVDAAGNTIWDRVVGDVRGVATYPTDGSVVATLIWENRVVKLSASGDLLWDRPTPTQVNTVAVDPRDGNIVLPTYFGSRVLKLAPDGTTLWDRNIGYAEHLYPAIDPNDGSIVISTGAFGVLVKLDANGNTLWQRTLSGILFESAAINAADGSIVACTLSGNVYRFDALGNLLGQANLSPADTRHAAINSATGRIHLSDTNNVVRTFNSSLQPVWTTAIAANLYIGIKLVVDPADNGIVGGTYGSQRLLKLESEGTVLWDRNLGVNIFALATTAPTVVAPPPPPPPPTPTAAQLVQQLLDATSTLTAPKGLTQSLGSKLQAAARSLERGNRQAARGQLQAFLQELAAQIGKKISAPDAAALVAAAQAALAQLE
jgi:outer membrane protein assembly factor BamB